MARRSFPLIEHLVGFLKEGCLASGDVALDVGAYFASRIPRTIYEIGRIHGRLSDRRDSHFLPAIRAGFHDTVPLRKILQVFSERLYAVECLRHLRGILARQLKEHLGADRENRGAHLGGILVKELIRGDDTYSEFAGFREQRFNAASVRHQVLDLVAVKAEEGSFGASEESILHDGKDQTSERCSLFS